MEEPALSIKGRQVETQQVDGDSEPAKAHVPSGLHMPSYHICPKVQSKRTNADNDIGPEACHTQVFGSSAPSHSLGSASRASMYPQDIAVPGPEYVVEAPHPGPAVSFTSACKGGRSANGLDDVAFDVTKESGSYALSMGTKAKEKQAKEEGLHAYSAPPMKRDSTFVTLQGGPRVSQREEQRNDRPSSTPGPGEHEAGSDIRKKGPLKRSDHMPHYRPGQRAGEAELTKASSPARMERLGRRKEAGSS